MKRYNVLVNLLSVALLAACGGGGGGSTTSVPDSGTQSVTAGQSATFSLGESGSFAIVDFPSLGQLIDNQDGTVTFDPLQAFDYLSEDETTDISYRYSDGSNTFVNTIRVVGINEQPQAFEVNISQPQGDGAITGAFNVEDPDTLDTHQFTLVTPPAQGDVTIHNDGTFTYLPADNFSQLAAGESQEITFSYIATDNSGVSSTEQSRPAAVTILITAGDFGDNHQPITDAISLFTSADKPIAGQFSVTDQDPSDQHQFEIVTQPVKGTVVNLGEGRFEYTPGNDFRGLALGKLASVSFTYRAVDDSGLANANSTPSTVFVSVSGTQVVENHQPVVQGLAFSIGADDANMTQFFSVDDADLQDQHSFSILSQPELGSVVNLNNGAFSFSPSNHFSELAKGDTRAVYFTYSATDSAGSESEPALVVITVTGTNQLAVSNHQPVVTANQFELTADSSIIHGVLTVTDSDPEDQHQFRIIEAPAFGQVTNHNDGRFTFDPLSDFDDLKMGAIRTVRFQYVADDSSSASNRTSLPAVVIINVTGINNNQSPTALDVALSMTADTAAEVGHFGVTDPDPADSHTYAIVDAPSIGKVTNLGNGSFSFDAVDDFAFLGLGEKKVVEFTYKAIDSSGFSNAGSEPASVVVTVEGVNDQPVALANELTAYEDGEPVEARFGKADPDITDIHQFILGVQPEEGKATAEQYNYQFDPESDFQDLAQGEVRQVSFSYTVDDQSETANAVSEPGKITINVIGVNDAPLATSSSFDVLEKGSLTAKLPATDIDGDPLVFEFLQTVSQGEFSYIEAENSFSFEPGEAFIALAEGEKSDVSFIFTAQDNSAALNDTSAEATVTLTVIGQNDRPVAPPINITVQEGGSASIDLRSGVIDPDTALLELVINQLSEATNGTVTNNHDGTVTYQHNGLESISDSFTYVVNDGIDDSDPATVAITVIPVNDAPSANADSYHVDEGALLNIAFENGVLANDTDPENTALTAVLVSDASHGELVLQANGSFSYQHDGSETTQDTFSYKVNDGELDSREVTATITIRPINDAPQAVADRYDTNEGDTLNIPVDLGILANDKDAEHDPLTIILLSDVAHGELDLAEDGSFQYIHNGTETFSDTFRYKINDGSADSDAVHVVIVISPVNDVPEAVADRFEMDEHTTLNVDIGSSILNNDSDAENATLTAVLVSDASHGELLLAPDGSFSYQHNGDEVASDSFSYQAFDGTDPSNTVTVLITIKQVNNAPVAVADEYRVNEGDTLNVPAITGVMANDSDEDGDALTAVLVSDVSHGTITLDPDGAFRYVNDGSNDETDSFSYKVSDSELMSDIVVVSLEITQNNAIPVAESPTETTEENTPFSGQLTATDDEGPIKANSFELLSSVEKGRLVFNSDGSYSFDPFSNFNDLQDGDISPVSFSYRVFDQTDLPSEPATVTINVSGTNDALIELVSTQLTREADEPSYSLNGETGDMTFSVSIANDPAAKYRNSFGFYFANAAGEPISGKLLATDSYDTSGLRDTPRQFTVSIDEEDVPEGAEAVGFFLVPDGGNYSDALNSDADRVAYNLTNTPENGYINGATVTFAQSGTGVWEAFIGTNRITAEGQYHSSHGNNCGHYAEISQLVFSDPDLNYYAPGAGTCTSAAADVVVAGSFNDWSTGMELILENNDYWKRKIYIESASDEFKYKLDGSWYGDGDDNAHLDSSNGNITGKFTQPGTYQFILYSDTNYYTVSWIAEEDLSSDSTADQEIKDTRVGNGPDQFIFGDIPNRDDIDDLYLNYKLIIGNSTGTDADEYFTGDATGVAVDDLVDGRGGNDILMTGKGSDILVGGADDDLFIWQQGDHGSLAQPDQDTLLDFSVSGADDDTLQLSQLLQGATPDTIDDYIQVTIIKDKLASGGGLKQGDTILAISPAGDGNVTLTITLQAWGAGAEGGVGETDWLTRYPAIWSNADDVHANPQRLLTALLASHNLFID